MHREQIYQLSQLLRGILDRKKSSSAVKSTGESKPTYSLPT